MELLHALATVSQSHPLWTEGLAALCGLAIAWRWHQEKRSMRWRALSIMAASAPRARPAAVHYLMVAIISVATTLTVGQVSWGTATTELPSPQKTTSTPFSTTPSSPDESSAAGLNLDTLLKHGTTIDIHISSAGVTEETQARAPTATIQPTEIPHPILVRPNCGQRQ